MLIEPNAFRLSAPVSSGDHGRGRANAPVTLVEYADFDCPDCAATFPVLEEVRKRTGDGVRFIFRHFPVVSVHPQSMNAAEAAEAAFSQGGEDLFWRMHDRLYHRGDKLGEADLTHHAVVLGLEIYRFQSELDTHAHEARVLQDIRSGTASSVRGTPTLFINGDRYGGPRTVEALNKVLSDARVTVEGNR